MTYLAQYPLPYAFARSQQLLLEDFGGDLTLWLHSLDTPGAASAVSEVMRKFDVQHVSTEAPELLQQRISVSSRAAVGAR